MGMNQLASVIFAYPPAKQVSGGINRDSTCRFREQAFTASCVSGGPELFRPPETSPLPGGAEASSSKVGAAGQRMEDKTYLMQ